MNLDILNADTVAKVLFLITPGFVITYFRSFFIKEKPSNSGDLILKYFTISVLYQAFLYPISLFLYDITGVSLYFFWPMFVFIIPCILGVFLGISNRKDWIRKLLRKTGVNPIHSVGVSWDWKFARTRSCYVFITLKNGYKYAGFISKDAFMSSDSTERDLYIDNLYEWKDVDAWEPLNRSILICAGEISTVEFIKSGD